MASLALAVPSRVIYPKDRYTEEIWRSNGLNGNADSKSVKEVFVSLFNKGKRFEAASLIFGRRKTVNDRDVFNYLSCRMAEDAYRGLSALAMRQG